MSVEEIIAEAFETSHATGYSSKGLAAEAIAAVDAAGYVVVPKEPTDEMIEAGLDSLRDNSSFIAIDRDPLFVYRAMISSRPKP